MFLMLEFTRQTTIPVHLFKESPMTRNTMLILIISAFFLFASPVLAIPLSCDDLSELSVVISDLADVVYEAGSIADGSEEDVVLGELIDALNELAENEDDQRLSNTITALQDSWQESQWDQFSMALSLVSYEFDRIYYNDCDDLTENEMICSFIWDISVSLDQVSQGIERKTRIAEDSALDLALRALLDDMIELESIGDAELVQQVKDLKTAWEELRWNDFAAAANELSKIYKDFYSELCGE